MGLDIYITRVAGGNAEVVVHFRKNSVAQFLLDRAIGNGGHECVPFSISLPQIDGVRIAAREILDAPDIWTAFGAKYPEVEFNERTPERETAFRRQLEEVADFLAGIQPPPTGTELIYQETW